MTIRLRPQRSEDRIDGCERVSEPLFPGSPAEPWVNAEELRDAIKALATGQIPVQTNELPVPAVPAAAPAIDVPSAFVPPAAAPGVLPPSPVATATPARHAAPPHAAPGWASAAIAINSFRHIENPLVLFLQPQGHGTIVIDLMAHEYNWTTPLAAFPH